MQNRIEQIQELLKANPKDSFLRHALALEHIKRGEDDRAEALFLSLLQDQPGYVGSYYHLAQLLERRGDYKMALEWYGKGMAAAKEANDRHAFNELQAAYDELTD